ncbi:MAG: hypothetical protein R3D84_07800 [Paracoccaceae bacterium]
MKLNALDDSYPMSRATVVTFCPLANSDIAGRLRACRSHCEGGIPVSRRKRRSMVLRLAGAPKPCLDRADISGSFSAASAKHRTRLSCGITRRRDILRQQDFVPQERIEICCEQVFSPWCFPAWSP